MKPSLAPFPPLRKRQFGYSIIEWMIVIMLTLFLTAGVLTVFVSSQRATTEALGSGERQENASFALQIITRELKQAYFFAQATGENKELWNLNGAAIAPSFDCLDATGSGTFPSAGQYRPLWASTVPAVMASLEMSCIDDSDSATTLITGSSFISVMRARGFAETVPFKANSYYLDIKPTGITVYLGDASALTTGSVAPVWQYIRHVYYLDKQDDIPRLRRLRLEKNKMVREEVLVEGIEDMQFMFALDKLIANERDGSMHALVGTQQVAANDWDSGRVIGIKVYLLVRALKQTAGYVNNDTYQMGTKSFSAPGDGYKRQLVSHVITFQNSVVLVDD
ncbi:PilW family protein [Psychromonas antarctica]|uniref:PilW family protein n=1 Tax=Psychromonas antarctica TaxID=67573 RepID=UPI001EE78280|nr:PilW family protein [Psychromonas antarctica]MCG6201141.1 PilW family protein [Psychromonas antarctica]